MESDLTCGLLDGYLVFTTRKEVAGPIHPTTSRLPSRSSSVALSSAIDKASSSTQMQVGNTLWPSGPTQVTITNEYHTVPEDVPIDSQYQNNGAGEKSKLKTLEEHPMIEFPLNEEPAAMKRLVSGNDESSSRLDKRQFNKILRQFGFKKDDSNDVPPDPSRRSRKVLRNMKKDSKQVETEELKESDIVIALMGPTASGKSSFISAVGESNYGVGHDLNSCTVEVKAVRVHIPELEDLDVVLVDTPGFDDTYKTDYEILKMISEWMKKAGKKKILLDGILYLHRISDNRMVGTPLKNLELFEKLCGPQAFSRVVMVTTMWDDVDEDMGKQREDELVSNFWASMMSRGTTTLRYGNTAESAWNILNRFIDRPKEGLKALQIQKETYQQKKELNATDAGQELYNKLEELEKRRKKLMRRLENQMKRNEANEDIVGILRNQHEWLERERQEAVGQLANLRLSVPQRFLQSFMKTWHVGSDRYYGQAARQATADRLNSHTFRGWGVREVPKKIHQIPPDAEANIRALLSDIVLKSSIQKVADTLVGYTEKAHGGIQGLVDYLDMVLRDSNSLEEQNRVLTLLSKIVVTAGNIIPGFLKLAPVPYRKEPVATGGYGKVHRGLKDEGVAVKMIETRISSDSSIKELILWAHLSHPNILPLYGVFFEKENIGLVSPWMNAGNLHDYVARTNDTQCARLPLIEDVIEGLFFLHQRDIVHSDLKGQNILISTEKRALIADFGSSHISTHTTSPQTNTTIGYTLHFSPPEIHEREYGCQDRPTKAWDIWSFGGVCYQVLSRNMPYHGMNDKRVVVSLVMQQLPLRPTASDASTGDTIDDDKWRFISQNCWVWDPKDRMSTLQLRDIVRGWGVGEDRPTATVLQRPPTIPAPVEPEIDMSLLKKTLLDIQASVRSTAYDEHDTTEMYLVQAKLVQSAEKCQRPFSGTT
ncbi:hypothetical protein NP233_g13008 [Leucocoprinus birnbaumii]|uniref:Protein kinase domain-containing protein n=1 Tax=Leucocoprinus birnbaumii TaxID=56174 RepID=A0AAD5VDG6_9AGAR|nr:hypothetical protein NP233_g13008 [Leucocoprinus birnbaumii]